MNYAYLRVSTQDKQEFARQEFALKDFAIDKIFEEKISGTKKATERPEFEKMLQELQKDQIYQSGNFKPNSIKVVLQDINLKKDFREQL